jgi:hypothetical protein
MTTTGRSECATSLCETLPSIADRSADLPCEPTMTAAAFRSRARSISVSATSTASGTACGSASKSSERANSAPAVATRKACSRSGAIDHLDGLGVNRNFGAEQVRRSRRDHGQPGLPYGRHHGRTAGEELGGVVNGGLGEIGAVVGDHNGCACAGHETRLLRSRRTAARSSESEASSAIQAGRSWCAPDLGCAAIGRRGWSRQGARRQECTISLQAAPAISGRA